MTAANSNATIRVEFICARDCIDEILITHTSRAAPDTSTNIINYYYGQGTSLSEPPANVEVTIGGRGGKVVFG